jgi:hypothetical protein
MAELFTVDRRDEKEDRLSPDFVGRTADVSAAAAAAPTSDEPAQ